MLAWWQPTPTSDGRSHFTADNVIVLAAIPIAGPLGAGIVGLSMALFARRRIAARRRIFNAAMTASAAMTGGLGYALAGGVFELEGSRGAGFLIAHVGFPIVVADLFNLGLNALLLAGVLRLSSGVPVRLQLRDMLTSTGQTQFAYGIIASLLVILWIPAQLGAVAVLLVMAPLLGARWALLQYGEERAARERQDDHSDRDDEDREVQTGGLGDLAAAEPPPGQCRDAEREGAGAVALDGQMLDEAVRAAARRTLARAGETA